MDIKLKQPEIETALKQYLSKKGFALDGHQVTISFVSGRAGNGLSADVSIDEVTVSAQAPTPTPALVPTKEPAPAPTAAPVPEPVAKAKGPMVKAAPAIKSDDDMVQASTLPWEDEKAVPAELNAPQRDDDPVHVDEDAKVKPKSLFG